MTNKIVVRAAVVRVERARRRVHADVRDPIIRLVPAGQHETVLVLAVAAVPLVISSRGCC